MLITFLEGKVPPEKEIALKNAYKDAIRTLEEGISQTFMSRSVMDPSVWRVFSVWTNKEAFEKVKNAPVPPKGLLIFRAVGVEPSMTLFEVVDQAKGG